MFRFSWLKSALFSFCVLMSTGTQAHGENDTKIVPLMNKEFADIAGKEGTMLTIEYAPGASTPKHRHDAHVFVYVLKGSIVMQADSGKAVTLKQGDTFYENPKDIHTVSKNASKTKPAKFVVFMVKNKGAAPVLPAN
jgi:quercetin dioxygenase-like cupin family protein